MRIMRMAVLTAAATMMVGAASASAATLKLFSVGGFYQQYNARGKVVPNSSKAKPQPGWSFVSFGTDYVGTQANHGAPAVGWDDIHCVVVKWPIGNCNGQIAYQGSVIDTPISHTRLDKNSNPTTYKVVYGTGVFAHVKRISASDVKGFPSDEEFTIPGVTPAASS